MKYFIGILVTLALAAVTFVVGVRRNWWKNPFASGTDNGDGTQTCPDGSTIPITGMCPTATSPTDCDPNKIGYQINGVVNPTKCGTPNVGEEDAAPSGSLLVNISELSSAPVIDNQYRPFDASAQNKLFNKATLSPIAVAPLIHYVAPAYPAAPWMYWWYKNGHYTFIKTEAGTHYYKKSILPSEIKLIVKRTDTCYADWYLSGSKYKLDREENLDGALRWCVYKKQS